MGVRRTVLAVVAVAVLTAGCTTAPRSAVRHPAPPAHHAHHAPVVLAAAPGAGSTLVAALHGPVPGSPAPGAPSTLTVPATWYGYPSVLPVIATRPHWVEVRLAHRPNGSTTWVPQADVTLANTPYRIVVNLATMHLTVFRDNLPILDFPAGIGTPDDPTVTGDYFIAMSVPPPGPGYGPFVLVTSAHSDAITDWEDSGDAIIAIHGPITTYDDSLIGTTGAAISHGCIRLHDADLAQLADVPDGTPLDIVAG